jgi:hypothetical protein
MLLTDQLWRAGYWHFLPIKTINRPPMKQLLHRAAHDRRHLPFRNRVVLLTPERPGIFPRLRNVFPLTRNAGEK